jgi:flagellar motor switch protein FliG
MMEPRMIADYVKKEHPQVIAFVLATLEPPKSSRVLEFLPEDLRSEVVYRVATMEDVNPSVVGELEKAVKSHVAENTGAPGFNLGGVKNAADLLNLVDKAVERKIMEDIRDIEEPVWAKLEEQLFTFEQIIDMDDKTLQLILRDVSSDQLGVALRGADEALKEAFLRNMSERASGILREEMEMMGPIKLKDVEKAQQEVVQVVKRLEEEGKIALGGKGGEEVFV